MGYLRKFSSTAILCCIMMLTILTFMYGIGFWAIQAVFAIVVLLFLLHDKKIKKIILYSFAFSFIVFCLCRMKGYFFDFQYLLTAVILSCYIIKQQYYILPIKIVYCVIAVLMFRQLMIHQASIGIEYLPLFEGVRASTNLVSVLMLGYVSIIYVVELKQEGVVSIWPSVLCLVLSIISMSRSGSLCSGILVAIVCYENILGKVKLSTIHYVGLLFGASVLAYLGYIYYNDLSFFIDFMNEKEGSMNYSENVRSEILSDYIKQLSLYKVFIGQNIENASFIAYLEGNPHNSFIAMLSNCGFMSFFALYLLGKTMLNSRHNIILFGCLFCLVLRAWTDTIFCGKIFDLFLFVPLVYSIYNYKQLSTLLDVKKKNEYKNSILSSKRFV